jgi:YidC/Oxa1 family membrane protein insertase
MEKRIVLAVILMTAVILVTNLLFPPPPPPERTAAEERPEAAEVIEEPAADPQVADEPAVDPARLDPTPPEEEVLAVDTVVVETPLATYHISTRGAALVSAQLREYDSFAHPGAPADMVARDRELLSHRLAIGRDTIDLRGAVFSTDRDTVRVARGGGAEEVRFRRALGNGGSVELVYRFAPDSYQIGRAGRVEGLGSGFTLITELGGALPPNEADISRWLGDLAVVGRNGSRVESRAVRRLEGREYLDGPLRWTGVKDRYFLAALISTEGPRFAGTVTERGPEQRLVGGADPDTPFPTAEVAATLPVGPTGEFAFTAYVGPMEYGRLAAVGADLEQVNPFGYRWLQAVLRPIAAVILWVLGAMHDGLGVGYGWVLILFGVLMRVVLWPLHAKAMRAQLRNMAVQPLMQEIREQYSDDPQRQQQEIIKLYKEHGFNPLAGCLPMLVPMPVLITLFFVFERTIEFRGEAFLWIPDLSLRDPLYILPIFLVISMFSLQIISHRLSGMEMNPQMRMMMYVMPLAFGFIFFLLPSGLNLYYATTNVATIPQQILIARERRKAQEEMKANKAALEREGKGKEGPVAAGPNRAERRRAQRKG